MLNAVAEHGKNPAVDEEKFFILCLKARDFAGTSGPQQQWTFLKPQRIGLFFVFHFADRLSAIASPQLG